MENTYQVTSVEFVAAVRLIAEYQRLEELSVRRNSDSEDEQHDEEEEHEELHLELFVRSVLL